MAPKVPWSALLQVLACMSVVLHYFALDSNLPDIHGPEKACNQLPRAFSPKVPSLTAASNYEVDMTPSQGTLKVDRTLCQGPLDWK